ncbi:MAG: Crp/Fnr family transcriptional regulator [Terriglobus roseus]|nr:Crp/Fnr family transcriptional regulator [Terriglobus roseus]
MIRKLSVAEPLTYHDHAVLTELCSRPRFIQAGRDIIRAGDPTSDVHLVLDGLAYRYKLLPDGNRQIVAVMVPGDFCDLHVAILGQMDHAIATFTACTVVDIPAATISDLTDNHPRITRALWWATLVDEAILREWLAGMGQREAAERMAHLFCELLVRLRLIDAADEGGYDLPLTQTELADIMGMTPVHVNRTLRDLREAGLVVLRNRRLSIPDAARLKAYCGFDPTYLHLQPIHPA